MAEMDMDSPAKRAMGPFVRLGFGNRLPDIYNAVRTANQETESP